jgi:hypothetical protein
MCFLEAGLLAVLLKIPALLKIPILLKNPMPVCREVTGSGIRSISCKGKSPVKPGQVFPNF